jgi:hypothetical protein
VDHAPRVDRGEPLAGDVELVVVDQVLGVGRGRFSTLQVFGMDARRNLFNSNDPSPIQKLEELVFRDMPLPGADVLNESQRNATRLCQFLTSNSSPTTSTHNSFSSHSWMKR